MAGGGHPHPGPGLVAGGPSDRGRERGRAAGDRHRGSARRRRRPAPPADRPRAPTTGWCSPPPTPRPASWPAWTTALFPDTSMGGGRIGHGGRWRRGMARGGPRAGPPRGLGGGARPWSPPGRPTRSGGGGRGTGHGPVPRAESVRDVLAPGLRAKGWTVDEVVAYWTVAGRPAPAPSPLPRADAVAFTSSSTVERTVDLLGTQVPPWWPASGPSPPRRPSPPGSRSRWRRSSTPSTGWWQPWWPWPGQHPTG